MFDHSNSPSTRSQSGSSRYLPKTWGTRQRFKDDIQPTCLETPGPGKYGLQEAKGTSSTLNPSLSSSSISQVGRIKVKAKKQDTRNTKLKKQAQKAIKKDEQKERQDKDRHHSSRPPSSFGLGKDSIDPWGRDCNQRAKTPGPGSYSSSVSGTFSALERTFGDKSLYTETAYLQSVEKRLKKIAFLERKNEAKGLGVVEKILFKQETKASTLKRLTTRRETLLREISSREETREKIMRPRSSLVLATDGPYGRPGRKGLGANQKQPSTIFHIGPRVKSEKSEDVFPAGSLLSSYTFGSVASKRNTSRGMRMCRTAPALQTVDDLVQEHRIPDEIELDEKGDEVNPQTRCVDELPGRRLRPPSFWGSQTAYYGGSIRFADHSTGRQKLGFDVDDGIVAVEDSEDEESGLL